MWTKCGSDLAWFWTDYCLVLALMWVRCCVVLFLPDKKHLVLFFLPGCCSHTGYGKEEEERERETERERERESTEVPVLTHEECRREGSWKKERASELVSEFSFCVFFTVLVHSVRPHPVHCSLLLSLCLFHEPLLFPSSLSLFRSVCSSLLLSLCSGASALPFFSLSVCSYCCFLFMLLASPPAQT